MKEVILGRLDAKKNFRYLSFMFLLTTGKPNLVLFSKWIKLENFFMFSIKEG